MPILRAARRNLWRSSDLPWEDFLRDRPPTTLYPKLTPVAKTSKKFLKRHYRGPFRRIISARGEVSFR